MNGTAERFDSWGIPAWPGPDLEAWLVPLLEVLETYEAKLDVLRKEGGRVRDLRQLADLMKSPIQLSEWPTEPAPSLASPGLLRSSLRNLHPGLHLELRKGPAGFPVHYLFRTSRDCFGNYSLILEDYHRGRDYDRFDASWDHFATVARYGEVERLLRLSPHRAAAAPWGLDADSALYTAGRTLFDAAWHDDQRLACAAAELLGMPRFRSTLELLYLCLGGELSRLRQALMGPRGAKIQAIIAAADPGGALQALAASLPGASGALVSGLREAAHRAFPRLGLAFTDLMQTRGVLPRAPADLPLFKIVVANYRRLEQLRPFIGDEARRAGEVLEATAAALQEELLFPLTAPVP